MFYLFTIVFDCRYSCIFLFDLYAAPLELHLLNHSCPSLRSSDLRAVCGNHIYTARVAKEAGVKTLVLTHMLEQIDQPGVREAMLREMMAIYDGNIIWGEDLMEIPVAGPRLANME